MMLRRISSTGAVQSFYLPDAGNASRLAYLGFPGAAGQFLYGAEVSRGAALAACGTYLACTSVRPDVAGKDGL